MVFVQTHMALAKRVERGVIKPLFVNMHQIRHPMTKESDWKHLSKLKPLALERLCRRILDEVQTAAVDPALSFHDRYLKIYALIQERDNDIVGAFDEMSRSKAWLRVLNMNSLGLLTEEELAGFSEEMRASLPKPDEE